LNSSPLLKKPINTGILFSISDAGMTVDVRKSIGNH
jgi:hypothetical protein